MSTNWTRNLLRGVIAGGLALCGGMGAVSFSTASADEQLPLELVTGLYAEANAGDGVQTIPTTGEILNSAELELCSAEGVCLEGLGATSPGGLLDDGFMKRMVGGSRSCCPQPWWAHRTGAFSEYLYLTAGSSDLIYAVEGTDPNPAVATPTGPIGIVDMDAESGFRVGFSIAASACSSLNVAYTRWDASSFDQIDSTDPLNNVLLSPLLHPTMNNTGATSLRSNAEHKMSFQTIDMNYRHLWKQAGALAVNWTGGLRYSNLEQTMRSRQTDGVAAGLADVSTEIDFEGFGLTGGLDLTRYSCETGLFIYGKGMTSLLAGDWTADYIANNQVGGGNARNTYEDFHATPILEGEVGLGWQSATGCVKLQSGYMMSGWYSAVTTRGYIDGVTNNDLIDIGETITFSGLTTRLTVQF